MKPEELTTEMESCRRLFVQDRTDEALRLSGEILAEADAILRNKKDAAFWDICKSRNGIPDFKYLVIVSFSKFSDQPFFSRQVIGFGSPDDFSI